MASLGTAGLGELSELIHETGHAIHVAGIRTRPAFADWPDSDALTEAIADLVAFDVAEPAWQRRWLPGASRGPGDPVASAASTPRSSSTPPGPCSSCGCWPTPSGDANEVWTELTVHLAGHRPASRVVLVGDARPAGPGAGLHGRTTPPAPSWRPRSGPRSATARGDWIDGDPGWYPWVRDRIYRFGRERPPG